MLFVFKTDYLLKVLSYLTRPLLFSCQTQLMLNVSARDEKSLQTDDQVTRSKGAEQKLNGPWWICLAVEHEVIRLESLWKSKSICYFFVFNSSWSLFDPRLNTFPSWQTLLPIKATRINKHPSEINNKLQEREIHFWVSASDWIIFSDLTSVLYSNIFKVE